MDNVSSKTNVPNSRYDHSDIDIPTWLNNGSSTSRTGSSYKTQNVRYDSIEAKQRRQNAKYNADGDYYEPETASAKKAPRKKSIGSNLIAIAAAFLTATGVSAAAIKIADNIIIEKNFDAIGRNVDAVSEFTGIEADSLMKINGIVDPDEPLDKIIVPEKFTGIEDEMKEIDEKIAKTDSKKKETSLKVRKYKLEELLEYQNENFYAYTDNDKQYLILIPKGDDIKLETVKSRYQIDNDVIRHYNDNLVGETAEMNGQEYTTYLNSDVPEEGIKIPLKKLHY